LEANLKADLESKEKEINDIKVMLQKRDEDLKEFKLIQSLEKKNDKLINTAIIDTKISYDESKGIPSTAINIIEYFQELKVFKDLTHQKLVQNVSIALDSAVLRADGNKDNLFFWLSFTWAIFIALKNGIDLDDTIFVKDSVSPDLPLETKFIHSIYRTSIRAFCDIFRLYSQQLDNTLSVMIYNSKDDRTPNICACFSNLLEMCKKKKHHINQNITNKLLSQLFYYMDIQSFNALLKKTDLFHANGGFQIKMTVSKLEGSLSKIDKQLNLI